MIFFVKRKDDADYQQVSKEEYVIAEREEGFYNTLGYPHEPATSSFSGPNGTKGYTEFESPADFFTPRREIRHGVDEW